MRNLLRAFLTPAAFAFGSTFAAGFLAPLQTQAFQILSPTSSACHERITLGALGRETGGFLGDGLPSAASLRTRFVSKVEQLGVPNNRGTHGVMNEMKKRFNWGALSDAEILVLSSFVAGVRSPDTNGSSIIDFNKLRSTHLRDTEQSAHALRRRSDDDPNGDTAGIAAARDRVSRHLQAVDNAWANEPYRTETWTFPFRGEHKVVFFAPAFDLGAALHTVEDSYAHAIRDNSMKILALENYIEVLIGDFRDDRDGVEHSERLDQCNENDEFDLMRITEARKQVANILIAVDGALGSSGSSLTAVQPTLDTVFLYQSGCTRANEYCNSPWWVKAKEEFSRPYSVGCGLVKNMSQPKNQSDMTSKFPNDKGGSPMTAAGGALIAFLISLPLLIMAVLRIGGARRAKSRTTFMSLILVSIFTAALFSGAQASAAFEDPTGGKPFLPWIWEDQFKPTIMAAGNNGNIGIFAGTIASTMIAHEYDQDVFEDFGNNKKWSAGDASYGAVVASGAPAILVAVGQLVFDQENGLMHGRSIALTSLTHITTAFIANRERPNKTNRLSFPSGHTANAFTTAASLAYAYGPWVGVPLYGAATYIAMARMADNAHWFSDTIAAAGIGIFWARASYLAKTNKDTTAIAITPSLLRGGGLVTLSREF